MRMLPGGILRLMTHTNESNVPISVHCLHKFSAEPSESLPVIERRRFVGRYTFRLTKGQTLRIEKLTCYHTGRDLPFTVYGQQRGTTNPDIVAAAGDALAAKFADTGYDALLAASAKSGQLTGQSRMCRSKAMTALTSWVCGLRCIT